MRGMALAVLLFSSCMSPQEQAQQDGRFFVGCFEYCAMIPGATTWNYSTHDGCGCSGPVKKP